MFNRSFAFPAPICSFTRNSNFVPDFDENKINSQRRNCWGENDNNSFFSNSFLKFLIVTLPILALQY